VANVKAAMEYAAKIERDALAMEYAAKIERDVLEDRLGRWVGLTDEEINSIDFPESGTATMRDFIRIIEAKLKEKNNG
tara:strand:- start:2 stop:235 length:234 start_codon:yes stop_codon:yes gene_type:complete